MAGFEPGTPILPAMEIVRDRPIVVGAAVRSVLQVLEVEVDGGLGVQRECLRRGKDANDPSRGRTEFRACAGAGHDRHRGSPCRVAITTRASDC